MADDVLIKYDDLSEVNSQLKSIIEEFSNVEDREDQLQNDIGEPYRQTGLKDRVHEFESGWKNRRKTLLEDIKEVQEHVNGVIEGFQKWDREAANPDNGGGSAPPHAQAAV